jgi:hypothetical protein
VFPSAHRRKPFASATTTSTARPLQQQQTRIDATHRASCAGYLDDDADMFNVHD